jgi:hypothetical protein
MKGTKVCSAKPGKNVRMNVHTKREAIQLMQKLTALGKDIKTYVREVQIRQEIKLINLNIHP